MATSWFGLAHLSYLQSFIIYFHEKSIGYVYKKVIELIYHFKYNFCWFDL